MSPLKNNSQPIGEVPGLTQPLKREYLLGAVLDNLPFPIKVIDQDYNVLYVNALAKERAGQFSHDIPNPTKCYQFFHHNEQPCSFCPTQMTLERGKAGYILLKNESPGDGKPCFEELLSLPVKTDDRETVDWVIEITRDVTKEKELEQQLIHSDRLIATGGMAASIAHELNNPLGIILGFAQDLLTEVEPADPRYESLKIIEEETQRCKKIMQSLLDFGRPIPPQFVRMDSGEVIRKSVDLLSPQFQKNNIQTILYVQENLPEIWADPQQLGQVLVNLFLNAGEAMQKGGQLTVQATAKRFDSKECFGEALSVRQEVKVAVTDTGCGISPGDLPRIFRPFFTTKSRKGMGLGLSICDRIVRAHGGRITVESGPLWGTTFALYFPVERRSHERNA